MAIESLSFRFALPGVVIDRLNLLDAIDECEYLLIFATTGLEKLRLFEKLRKVYSNVRKSYDSTEKKMLEIEQHGLKNKENIIKYVNSCTLDDQLLCDKLKTFFEERRRILAEDFCKVFIAFGI